MDYLPGTFYYHRYGHESYWMREASNGKLSLKALQVLIPYLSLFDIEDINYMMAEGTRDTWFDNLEQRPIRLKQETIPQLSLPRRIKRKFTK
jgi:hypothetical protein